MRTEDGSPKPASGLTMRPSRSSEEATALPSPTETEHEVRDRRQRLQPELDESCEQALAPDAGLGGASRDLALLAEARPGGVLRRLAHVEGVLHLVQRHGNVQGHRAPADAQPGQPVDLRERAQHHHAAVGEQVLAQPVGIVRIVDVLVVGLVEDRKHVVGKPVEEACERVAPDHAACRVVRVRDVDDLRAGSHAGGERVEVVAAARKRRAHRDRAHLGRVDRVHGERRPAERDLVPGLEHRQREVVEHRVGAVAHHDLLGIEPVLLGKRRPQGVAAAVGVAVPLGCGPRDRLERRGERAVLPLVRGQLDARPGQPELALHELDGAARLVRNQAVERRPERRIGAYLPCLSRYQRRTSTPDMLHA